MVENITVKNLMVMAGLDINDDNKVIVPSYKPLIRELKNAKIKDILMILQSFEKNMDLKLGGFGAIDPGPGGCNYTRVRNFLINEEKIGDLPLLRQHLTEPVHHLPPYQHRVGPGSMTVIRVPLNTCCTRVRNNIHSVLGMLLMINTPDSTPPIPDNLLPLHTAIRDGKLTYVIELLEAGALWETDINGQPLLFCLLTEWSESANYKNLKYTECMEFILENQKEKLLKFKDMVMTVLFELVSSKADLEVKNNNGDTPLLKHVKEGNQDCVCDLLIFGANIEARDVNGDSPLHIAISENLLSIVKFLLSFHANTYAVSNKGQLPLHIAANSEYKNGEIIQQLKLYFAPKCPPNFNGCTIDCRGSRKSDHHYENKDNNDPDSGDGSRYNNNRNVGGSQDGSKSSLTGRNGDQNKGNSGQDENGEKTGFHDHNQQHALTYTMDLKRKEELENLLSLDGGGMRGLILIEILLHIQNILNDKIIKTRQSNGKVNDTPPDKLETLMPKFHWIAGTSIGAILAAALSAGKTLKECHDLILRLRMEVFKKRNPTHKLLKLLCGGGKNGQHKTKRLEKLLREVLGEGTLAEPRIGEKNAFKLLITAVDNGALPLKLRLFRSYRLLFNEATVGIDELGFDNTDIKLFFIVQKLSYPLWKAARCSSAAPTYFGPYLDSSSSKRYIDGGLVANNPTLDLLTEVQIYNASLRLQNQIEKYEKFKEVKVGCVISLGTGFTIDKDLTSNWIKNLYDILLSQVTESEGRPVVRSRTICHAMNVPFFRFSPQLDKEIELDEIDTDKLMYLKYKTQKYMEKKDKEIEDILKLLMHPGPEFNQVRVRRPTV